MGGFFIGVLIMKQPILKALTLTALMMATAPTAYALSGDTKLACEAVLCLSSGTRPSECTPSLRKYFSITDKKPHKMVTKRLNFLKLCPVGHEPKMPQLLSAIAAGAGRCDAKFLNQYNRQTITVVTYERVAGEPFPIRKEEKINIISSKKPNYCGAYENHEFTDNVTAKYVGDERNNGFWVEPADYERALREYQDNLQRSAQDSSRNTGRLYERKY